MLSCIWQKYWVHTKLAHSTGTSIRAKKKEEKSGPQSGILHQKRASYFLRKERVRRKKFPYFQFWISFPYLLVPTSYWTGLYSYDKSIHNTTVLQGIQRVHSQEKEIISLLSQWWKNVKSTSTHPLVGPFTAFTVVHSLRLKVVQTLAMISSFSLLCLKPFMHEKFIKKFRHALGF